MQPHRRRRRRRSVSVAGSVVTVTPVSAGESVVTVTATDAGGSNRTATQTFTVTVAQDGDGDGLIGILTPAQLDAVRHDLDGDGEPTTAGAAGHAAVFGVTGGGTLSCAAAGGCRGYELRADLDFDTSGGGGPDAGDAYWRGGAGWLPLGTAAEPFAATFEGNGRVIRHLFIDGGDGAGRFGATASSSVIRHVGLAVVDVSGANGVVGGLAGANGGLVTAATPQGGCRGRRRRAAWWGRTPASWGAVCAAVEVSGSTSAGGVRGRRGGAGGRLHVPGGGGCRRRRGVAQRSGGGGGPVRVHGDAVALGRAVAGGDGRGRGDDGFHLRVDGGERVGFPDADGRRGRYRLREGDLRGGGQRGRSADGGRCWWRTDG